MKPHHTKFHQNAHPAIRNRRQAVEKSMTGKRLAQVDMTCPGLSDVQRAARAAEAVLEEVQSDLFILRRRLESLARLGEVEKSKRVAAYDAAMRSLNFGWLSGDSVREAMAKLGS